MRHHVKASRRLVSLLLSVVMVLGLLTPGFAAGSGALSLTEGNPHAGYDADLPSEESGSTVQAEVKEDNDQANIGLEESGTPAAQNNDASAPAPEDEVTFIVSLDKESLLEAGFSGDDIAADTASVSNYVADQKDAVELFTQALEDELGSDAVEVGYTYTVAMTGLSITTTYENKAAIQEMPGVDRVYVAPVFSLPEEDNVLEPYTNNATSMIGSNVANQSGWTGKGMRIAILDTGIVADHPNFQAMSEDKLAEDSMTVEDVQNAWSNLNASDSNVLPASTYFSNKIPFAFNYAGKSIDVSHTMAQSDHGTHVAGIAAANKIAASEVVGVAPDAQLIVMQVFSGDGANWDTVMAALEDCVYLNVDTANLSLGSAAGFVDNDAPMTELLDLLEQAGVEVIIAAGNDTNNALNNNHGNNLSLTGNPDTGLVGNPSTYSHVLSVASVDNDRITQQYVTVGDTKIGYNDSGVFTRLENLAGNTYEYVMIDGYGASEDFQGKDVQGKVAVLWRGGGVAFTDKHANAQNAGAAACIVVNNTAGLLNMAINDAAGNIPCVLMVQEAWDVLASAETKTLTVTGKSDSFQIAKTMSDFSSWGPAPDLSLKPEITGVGGNVYSTRDTATGYGNMSGTSMATPQVTGAMTVLMQYLRSKGYSNQDMWTMATNILMSTADPIDVPGSNGLKYSPRLQGAGLVNLVRATTVDAYLSSTANSMGRAKAELGDNSEGTYSFEFSVTNISDETKTYTFNSDVQTETATDGFIANTPYLLESKVEVSQDSVTVAAGETITLTATLTLTEADKEYINSNFENGMYVEGYLYLEGADNENLTMPFLGYYGDWSKPPVFDNPDYNEASLYGTGVFTMNAQLGTNPYLRNGAAGDEYNAFSYANPLMELDFGMLRNARKLVFRVNNTETGEEYFNLVYDYATKSYYNSSYGQIFPFFIYNATTDEEYVWNGYDKEGNQLPDGTTITYTVEAYVDDGDDVVDDSFSFQASLDNQKPQLLNADNIQDSLKVENGQVNLTLELQDNANLAAILFVSPDGSIIGKFAPDPDDGSEYQTGQAFEQTFNVAGYGADFTIVLGDYACNETEIEVALELDDSALTPSLKELEQGRLYGFEPYTDSTVLDRGWFSIDKGQTEAPRNETYENTAYFSGEYINGRVLAQRNDGALVLLSPYSTYWGSQVLYTQNGQDGSANFITLYDMALSHDNNGGGILQRNGEDALYAVGWTYDGTITPSGSYGGSNNLYEVCFTPWGYTSIEKVATITGLAEGYEILTLSADEEGNLYAIGTDLNFYSLDKQTGAATWLMTMADFKVKTNGERLSSIQSMTYDYEEDVIYWYAHAKVGNTQVCETYKIDPVKKTAESLGSRAPSGTSALFIPNDLGTDLFTVGEVNPTGVQLEPYKTTMVVNQGKRMNLTWAPWNAAAQQVTWTSDNTDVATVSETGYVKAIGPGTATITGATQIMYAGQTEWTPYEVTCQVTVVESQDALYGYIVTDDVNKGNQMKWVTYSDQAPTQVTQLNAPKTTTLDGTVGSAIWAGGTYYNGYVYTVQQEQWVEDNVIYNATVLYRTLVTGNEDPTKTTFGEPERIGHTENIEVGNIGFDYNTGRMYGVDLTNGGLVVIDIETGAVDPIGEFKFPEGFASGDNVMTAMAVICEGEETTILCGSMNGNLFIVDPDTMEATKVYSSSQEYWFYAGMTYDYNTGNIYWNPSMGSGINPLFLVTLEDTDWGSVEANVMDLGDVSSRSGVEQTAMFTITENEPETNYIPVEDLWLTTGETYTGLAGAQVQLQTSTEPARPTVQKRTWSSDNTDVATVDAFGKVTLVDVGTATITVSLTDRDGTVYSDSITFTVLPAVGSMAAFMARDDDGSQYANFWITVNDYDPANSTVGQATNGAYTVRAGEYFDGYYYVVDDLNNFMRIDADSVDAYTVLGNTEKRVVDLAFDYTTGTMYGLTLSYKAWNSETFQQEQTYPELVKIDLTTGALTTVCTLDTAGAFTLAADKDGNLYTAGSTSTSANAVLYQIDAATGACTQLTEVEGAVAYTDQYGAYNSQLSYDFGTDRLYFHAANITSSWCSSSNFYMIEKENDSFTAMKLGNTALNLRGESMQGYNAVLGMLCPIPEDSELPEMDVINLMLDRTVTRMLEGTTMTMNALVQPAVSSDKAQLEWTSSDESVATVAEDGTITAVAAGETTITVTDTVSGLSASCQLSVLSELSGDVAYTISQGIGLVAFDPELPNEYVVVNSAMPVDGKLVGVDVDDSGRYLYYAVYDDGSFPLLYRYDIQGNTNVYMGQLQTDVQVYTLAYDDEHNVIYLGGGYYLYQYYVPSLQTTDLNPYTSIVFDSDYTRVHTVACANGKTYVLGKYYEESRLMEVALNMQTYTILENTDLQLNTVENSCEMSYSEASGTFYVTDAGNNLYSFNLPDENGSTGFQKIDLVGGGLNVTGLGIYNDPDFNWDQEDSGRKYDVTITPTENGTVKVDPTSAAAGTQVTITATPDQGYEVGSIVVTDAEGNTIAVTNNAFTMPAGGATVTVTFKAVAKADKTLLQKTYDYAVTLSTEGVTDTAKAAFEKALENAKSVLDNDYATQDEVNAAWDQLLEGIWGLGLVQGSKEELNKLIAKADEMMENADKYVADHWQELVDALAKAKEVAADGDAMDEDIQPVAQALLNAILAQRFKANKDILNDLINRAEDMDLSGYTAESVATFRSALAAAQAVMADETLTEDDQKTVDDAAAALQAAINGLTAEGETQPSDKPETSDKPEVSDKPETTDQPQTTEKPNETPAQTGDSSQLMLYVAVMFAAVCALGATAVVRKRRS